MSAFLTGLQDETQKRRAEEQIQFVMAEMKKSPQVADICYSVSLRSMKTREEESLLHRNANIVVQQDDNQQVESDNDEVRAAVLASELDEMFGPELDEPQNSAVP